jgi:ribose 5-phosphate isomerase A
MNTHELKIEAAKAALSYVKDGMKLGIGTGSTANEFIKLLGAQVANGLTIVGVATSQASADLCRACNIPLTTLDDALQLDLTIDGTDEIDGDFNLIKGGGGALLYEKIVAQASKTMLVIADQSKVVDCLGAFPLPIEVNKFGLHATKNAIEKSILALGLNGEIKLRIKNGEIFETNGGHFILDASFSRILNAQELSSALFKIAGVVEHGLFLNIAKIAIIAAQNGIKTLKKDGL